jgi:ACR3 family arsenite efflux pump ArsB
MDKNKKAAFFPLLIVFVLLNTFFITSKSWLAKKGIEHEVLIIGNLLICLVSLISIVITQRSFKNSNPNVFVRAVYSSFVIKFFILAIAALVYIVLSGKNVSRPAIFSCMGLYVIYSFIEVSALLRLLKQKKNA